MLDFSWFLPSIWRYRKPIGHFLFASLFIQLFALVTPLFFQVVGDKVLVHNGGSTLIVIVVGPVVIGLFDVTLQYLRSYRIISDQALVMLPGKVGGKFILERLMKLTVSLERILLSAST